MKIISALLLSLCLLLAGCSQEAPPSSSGAAPEGPSSQQLSPALQRAEAEKAEILVALQEKIAQYQAGEVVNNPLEPRFEPFPEGEEYPLLTSVEDFSLEEGNEMFGVMATVPLKEHTMLLYPEYFSFSANDKEDGSWAVSAVGFLPNNPF